MADIFTEIREERRRQDAQWGGASHDDEHGYLDWAEFRENFESRIDNAASASPFDGDVWRAVVRDSLLKIAALCVAQIESLDRGEADATD